MKQPELPAEGKVVHLEPMEQAPLFSDFDVGAELLTIEKDAASGKHTGSTLERRTKQRDEICERLCAGVSLRKIQEIYGVGRGTVSALVKRLEASGKMEPLKRRLAGKLGTVAELSADLLIERLESGAIQNNVIPIAMGVALDKKADLEARDSDEEKAEPGLNAEALNEWVRGLPSDGQSDAGGPNAA